MADFVFSPAILFIYFFWKNVVSFDSAFRDTPKLCRVVLVICRLTFISFCNINVFNIADGPSLFLYVGGDILYFQTLNDLMKLL